MSLSLTSTSYSGSCRLSPVVLAAPSAWGIDSVFSSFSSFFSVAGAAGAAAAAGAGVAGVGAASVFSAVSAGLGASEEAVAAVVVVAAGVVVVLDAPKGLKGLEESGLVSVEEDFMNDPKGFAGAPALSLLSLLSLSGFPSTSDGRYQHQIQYMRSGSGTGTRMPPQPLDIKKSIHTEREVAGTVGKGEEGFLFFRHVD